VKKLNAATGMYYVKLRAVNGRGAGAASPIIAINTIITGLAAVLSLV